MLTIAYYFNLFVSRFLYKLLRNLLLMHEDYFFKPMYDMTSTHYFVRKWYLDANTIS